MKKRIVMLSLFGGLLACTSKTNKVKKFIPGTYVRFFDHEMRKEYDTLRIEPLEENLQTYKISKSLSFQKKLDGHVFPWQWKNESWTAIYDETSKVLQETAKGRVISFAPHKKALFVGSTEYKKIQ